MIIQGLVVLFVSAESLLVIGLIARARRTRPAGAAGSTRACGRTAL